MTDSLNKALDIRRFPKITFVGDRPDEELNRSTAANGFRRWSISLRAVPGGDRVGLLYPSEPMLVLSWLAALQRASSHYSPRSEREAEPVRMENVHESGSFGKCGWQESYPHRALTVSIRPVPILSLAESLRPERNLSPLPALPAAPRYSRCRPERPATANRSGLRSSSRGPVLDYNEVDALLDADDRLVSWLPCITTWDSLRVSSCR